MNYIVEMVESSPEVVTASMAVLAVIVSLVSILLTIVTLYYHRKHNYKAVSPLLNFGTWDYEDSIIVEIKNDGIGPLFIKESKVTDSGKIVHKENLIDWMPSLNSCTWRTFKSRVEGEFIPPQSKITLLQLDGDVNDNNFTADRDLIREALSDLSIIIEYTDIYDRKMPQINRSLGWFGRNS